MLHHKWYNNLQRGICRLSLEHMIYTINHGGDKVIFFDSDIKPLVEFIDDRIKDRGKAFVYISEKPGLPETKIAPLYEYEALIKDQPKTYDWPDLDEDTHAVLYYTTGTTGLPKGALNTNRQVYLHCIHGVANSGMAASLPKEAMSTLLKKAIPSC